jgi:hypothetical protein
MRRLLDHPWALARTWERLHESILLAYKSNCSDPVRDAVGPPSGPAHPPRQSHSDVLASPKRRRTYPR